MPVYRSASAGGSVDLLTATYGLLFATKAVWDTQSLAIKPEEIFSRTFWPWDLDCAGNEGDSMLQAAEEQLSQPGLMQHPLLHVRDLSRNSF